MLTREGAKLGDQFRSRLLEKLHVFDWFDPTHPLIPLGIYGEISYSVSRQSQEIGIRERGPGPAKRDRADPAAYAARRRDRRCRFVRGCQGIASLLFGIEPADPLIFTMMMSLLGAVGLLAAQIPARRASCIAPMAVLGGL